MSSSYELAPAGEVFMDGKATYYLRRIGSPGIAGTIFLTPEHATALAQQLRAGRIKPQPPTGE